MFFCRASRSLTMPLDVLMIVMTAVTAATFLGLGLLTAHLLG